MANLYVEVKYNNGQTNVVSNCDTGTPYYNTISIPDESNVDEMTISSKCDRNYQFGFDNDNDGFSLYGNVATVDANIYNGYNAYCDIYFEAKKVVFTNNVSYINIRELYFDVNNQYDECELVFENTVPPTFNPTPQVRNTKGKLKTIYVPKDAIEKYKATEGFFKDNADKIIGFEPVSGDYIDTINIEGVDYKIKDTSSQPEPVDAYTKEESDDRYASKSEFASVSGDVENALGEIAALGIDKQDKLSGDYVKDVEIGGGYITFNSMKFDGNNNGVKTANFKTINNQAILGSGNINIPSAGTDVIRNIGSAPLVTHIETLTKSEYDSMLSKGKLSNDYLYIITE